MVTQTKKYIVSFPVRSNAKRMHSRGFYSLARKHIVKGKRGGSPDLSRQVDKVVYGI